MAQDEVQVETRSGVKTILVVEDDINIGEVLVQAITQETSFLAILVSDGYEAMQTVKGVRPDLFILDYQLPRMNGIEIYDNLHAIPELAHVPALMISARLPEKDLAERTITGMHKPLDLDEFLQMIEDLVV